MNFLVINKFYKLQTFYLTRPFCSGNSIIRTKALFLLTLENGASKDAASFPCVRKKKISRKRKIIFDWFESPSFLSFNSIRVSQKSDRPHSATFRLHIEDFSRNIRLLYCRRATAPARRAL